MGFSRYNKDRPFLVITEIMTPKQGTKTESANFGLNDNFDHNESIVLVDRVTNRHITDASTIVDVLQRKLVKSRFRNVAEEKDIVDHFLQKYNEYVAEGIQIWLQSHTQNVEDARALVEQFEKEMEANDDQTATS